MKSKILITTFFVLVLSIVYGIFYFLALIKTPIDLSEKLEEHLFNSTFKLQNLNNSDIKIKDFVLYPNSSITLRSLNNLLFISWDGEITKKGLSIKSSNNLKVENSIYGKYSIEMNKTKWKELFSSKISEESCSAYTIKWFYPMPKNELLLSMKNENNVSFYQNIHYKEMKEIEIEENFKRFSNKGSHFYYRYHCEYSGENNRLNDFIDIVDKLVK